MIGTRRRTALLYRAVLPLNTAESIATAEVIDVVDDWIEREAERLTGQHIDSLPGRKIKGGWELTTPQFSATVVESTSSWACQVSGKESLEFESPWNILSAGVYLVGDRVMLDVAHFANLPADNNAPVRTPPILRDLLASYTANDGYPVSSTPIDVVSQSDVAELVRVLQSSTRVLPIVVLSEPYALNASALAEQLLGVAHVVRLDQNASFLLSNLLTKQWSVYGGAVRTYAAPFRPTTDYRQDHPLALLSAVAEFERDGVVGPSAFQASLVERTFRMSTHGMNRFERVDSLFVRRELLQADTLVVDTERNTPEPMVQPPVESSTEPPAEAVAQQPAEEPASDSSEIELLRIENDELRNGRQDLERQNNELQARLTQYENDFYAMLAELDDLKAQRAISGDLLPNVRSNLRPLVNIAQSLMAAVQGLSADFDTIDSERREARAARYTDSLPSGMTSESREVPKLTSLAPKVVEEWIQENCDGKLVLHPRAAESLTQAEYEAPDEIGDALLLLANEYHAMKNRSPDQDELRVRFEDALSRNHLIYSGSISDNRLNAKLERYYTVSYRGSERVLDMHLKNTSRTADPKYCLRIYFFYDEEEGRVVVGWLPGHLPNRLS